MNLESWPLGVFTSIDAGLGVSLDVAHELGVPTIQLHAPVAESRHPAAAREFLDRLESLDIRLTAVFGGFAGESYADIPAVEQTVGLVPPATRQDRLSEMKQISDFSELLNCAVVALHLGFVPHDPNSSAYQQIVDTTRELCQHCAGNSQSLHLETGQETATGLVQFMNDVACPNLFVNFDPANMILYGTGQPIDALQALGERVRSVHCKDATWSDQPGVTWGAEVPLGDGAVDFPAYLRTLREIGYTGPLTIEREIPQEPQRQKAEIARAVEFLETLRADLAPI